MDISEEEFNCFVHKRDCSIEEFSDKKIVERLFNALSGHEIPGRVEDLIQRMLITTKIHVGDAIDSKDIDDSGYPSGTGIDVQRSQNQLQFGHGNGQVGRTDIKSLHGSSQQESKYSTRDSYFTYPALRTLREKYLIQKGCILIERPQHVWLRTALQMHLSNMEGVKTAYDLMSCFKYIPDTTILVSSGSQSPAMLSSYLMSSYGDQEGIFNSLERAVRCTSTGGCIGVGLQSIPFKRHSDRQALAPVLDLYNATANVIDRGPIPNSKSIALFLEPWHASIQMFLRKCHEQSRTEDDPQRPLYGLMVNDLLLITSCGPHFEHEYLRLERAGLGKSTIKARDLWNEIMEAQIRSGGPLIIFKDTCNRKSNQRDMGAITQSNSLGGIIQVADQQETAVTLSASVVLSTFVDTSLHLEFSELERAVRNIVISLNLVLAQSYYPDTTTKASAYRHRAISIGVDGLGDTLAIMGLSYDSEAARTLNAAIAETVYHSAMDETCNQIRVHGPYPQFDRSPAASGWLQIDYWDNPTVSGRYDFGELREKVIKGTCNALVTGYAPSSSAIELASCSEGCEPLPELTSTQTTSLNTTRTVVSKHLMKSLEDMGLWSEDVLNQIVDNGGSIQQIEGIPDEMREAYKTAWEIAPHKVLNMAVDRAPFICQSQSLNAYMIQPSTAKLSNLVFSAWKTGLKTGLCSLRSRSVSTVTSRKKPHRLVSSAEQEMQDDGSMGSGTTDDPYYLD
ncbi:ribonucleotide reductase [Ephemerocybe angulata]|uniref:Ribonucleoside-diphosphate reductase n=1 Tax=Ephemerocybe angulata TaxID=980116 RepID=A0A8H6LUA7_9AGAR|nr:ribonucleotide reductase [Tulosesus angulatus]